MLTGHATADGTARYSVRFTSAAVNRFYREAADGLTSPSLGIGTYLGAMDEATDRAYTKALLMGLQRGINFIDTSLNYRHQHSERNVGDAIAQAVETGEIDRSEVVVCTKGGFLAPDAIPFERVNPTEIAGRVHCMSPAFLGDQIERSRRNLGLETIDVYYVHNPETQLESLPDDVVYERIEAAFEELEKTVAANRIRAYGVATWTAFREKPGSGRALSLGRLIDIARRAGGPGHHFRYIQLPVNLAMHEAVALRFEEDDGQRLSVLELASRSGIVVVASATLLQARLSRHLPEEVGELTPGARTDALRAIQFTRSTPGVTVALVGMGRADHVIENLEIQGMPPLDALQYERFYP